MNSLVSDHSIILSVCIALVYYTIINKLWQVIRRYPVYNCIVLKFNPIFSLRYMHVSVYKSVLMEYYWHALKPTSVIAVTFLN